MSLTLSRPQYVFLRELDTKYRAFVGGFGSGKTYVGALDLLLFAGQYPKTVQGYFGPSYPAIRDIFYPTIEEAAESLGYTVEIKYTDKEVLLYRGGVYFGTIICRSMDQPGSIIGFKIARALVDEIDTLGRKKAQRAWNKIIARLRLCIPGVVNGIGVTTTPEGFGFVYERFARDPSASYSMVQASTYENERFLPEDYISSLRETYPSDLIEAYINGRFVNLETGNVYRLYDRHACGSEEVVEGDEPLAVGMDFNVGDMAASILVRRPNGWHAVDEITGGQDTPDVIDTLLQRYPNSPITVYPDASGKARDTRKSSQSDHQLLQDAGFRVRAPNGNPLVRDRVNAVNAAFDHGKLWVNARRAPNLARCLEQQPWGNNGEPDKTQGLDHHPDGLGYFVHYELPLRKPTLKHRKTKGH